MDCSREGEPREGGRLGISWEEPHGDERLEKPLAPFPPGKVSATRPSSTLQALPMSCFANQGVEEEEEEESSC